MWILLKISLKFVPKGPINNIPSLVQIMAWGRAGDKPLSEPTMVSLLTHICVTRPQWVKVLIFIFPGTGCPIPDVDYLCLLCIDFYVWDAVSTFNHLPRMFLSTDFAFWITDWTCCHGPYLHAILRIISRSVSGLATDSPCGVWGRGWTTCLLHDSPLFGSHFKMRVGM